MSEQMHQHLMRENWLTKEMVSNDDYRALLSFLRSTPWGVDWAGAQTYSRAPGLSLAELDQAWGLERWRFAGKRSKFWYGLPRPSDIKLMGIATLLAALATVMILLQRGPSALVMPGLVALGLAAGLMVMWKQYQPYHQAKQAYEQRRAALLAGHIDRA